MHFAGCWGNMWRQWPPKLETSYSVQCNDALNIVIGNTCSCQGIDLLFNPPYLYIFMYEAKCLLLVVLWLNQPRNCRVH